MMIEEARAFDRLVAPSKKGSTTNTVTWENPKQLEEFITKLQDASEKLATHNR